MIALLLLPHPISPSSCPALLFLAATYVRILMPFIAAAVPRAFNTPSDPVDVGLPEVKEEERKWDRKRKGRNGECMEEREG